MRRNHCFWYVIWRVKRSVSGILDRKACHPVDHCMSCHGNNELKEWDWKWIRVGRSTPNSGERVEIRGARLEWSCEHSSIHFVRSSLHEPTLEGIRYSKGPTYRATCCPYAECNNVPTRTSIPEILVQPSHRPSGWHGIHFPSHNIFNSNVLTGLFNCEIFHPNYNWYCDRSGRHFCRK